MKFRHHGEIMERFSLTGLLVPFLGITSGNGEQKRSWLMELRHKSALKILGTKWKFICPKCSEEEEDQEARRLEMPTSQDQDGQCRS